MSISTALSSVKNNFSKYVIKGAGVATLGVIGYDAHVLGKLQSDVYSKSKDADACMGAYSNTQYLTSPSITASNLKKGVFNFEVESNFQHFVNSALGYQAAASSHHGEQSLPGTHRNNRSLTYKYHIFRSSGKRE